MGPTRVGLGRGRAPSAPGTLLFPGGASFRPDAPQPKGPTVSRVLGPPSQWRPDVKCHLLAACCPLPHKMAALPLTTTRRAAHACRASNRSRTGAGKPQAAIASLWVLRPNAQRSCQMQSKGNYKVGLTKKDVWGLFGWPPKTAEDGMEPMEVDPLEDEEEPMEVNPIPAELAGYCNADPRLCLKKGAHCAERVWSHPRLYRCGPSSLAVVPLQAGSRGLSVAGLRMSPSHQSINLRPSIFLETWWNFTCCLGSSSPSCTALLPPRYS